MLTLRTIQAHEGDCLLLLHDGDPILVDGGPKGTYVPFLRDTLHHLDATLELALVSHVDTDHITGILDLFAAARDARDLSGAKPRIRNLWMNEFGPTVDTAPRGAMRARLDRIYAQVTAQGHGMSLAAATVQGIGEGHRLTVIARQLGIPLNAPSGGKPLLADAGAAIQVGNLQLDVVGPTQANLDALRVSWAAWLEEQESRIARGEIDVAAMSDKSIPNLSSVQLLVRSTAKTLLLTGDGRGDHLIDALEAKGLMNAGAPLHVDVLKVPHHGSDRNVTAKFFERVQASTYVISANGKDGNPDPPTLKWIVMAAKKRGEKISIVLTNEPPHVTRFRADYPEGEFGYTLRVRQDGAAFIDVTVDP